MIFMFRRAGKNNNQGPPEGGFIIDCLPALILREPACPRSVRRSDRLAGCTISYLPATLLKKRRASLLIDNLSKVKHIQLSALYRYASLLLKPFIGL